VAETTVADRHARYSEHSNATGGTGVMMTERRDEKLATAHGRTKALVTTTGREHGYGVSRRRDPAAPSPTAVPKQSVNEHMIRDATGPNVSCE
jgi:hypothetical protein